MSSPAGHSFRAVASSGILTCSASRHDDREGRHYYMTAPQAAVRLYSSGDPRGRHASNHLAIALGIPPYNNLEMSS